MGDLAEDGQQLRPANVWFEEPVPKIEEAIPLVQSADIFAVVGTSLVVYPAAGLVHYTRDIPKYVVDKKIPYLSTNGQLTLLEMPATEGMAKMCDLLRQG